MVLIVLVSIPCILIVVFIFVLYFNTYSRNKRSQRVKFIPLWWLFFIIPLMFVPVVNMVITVTFFAYYKLKCDEHSYIISFKNKHKVRIINNIIEFFNKKL